jgi:hypothetical protein
VAELGDADAAGEAAALDAAALGDVPADAGGAVDEDG